MKSVVVLAIIWQLTAVTYAEDETQFSNTWVAEINGGPSVADQVAKKAGLSYKGPVLGFENYYIMTKEDLPEVLNKPNPEITQRLMSFPEVKWVEQQQLLKITLANITNAEGNGIVQPQSTDTLNKSDVGGSNLNLVPVHKTNITGKNIVLAVVDTRVKKDHPDLEGNFMSIHPGNYCTIYFSGNPALCPEAFDIIKLTESANHNLTYRDFMHLITMSTEITPIAENDGTWYENAKGFWVSNDFGFGLLNAENMVQLAKNWKTVPKKTRCKVKVKLRKSREILKGRSEPIKVRTKACHGGSDAVKFLEQLEVETTIKYPYGEALNLAITSPSKTKTIPLETQPYGNSTNGEHKWNIKSLHTWGENPRGLWKIEPLEGVNATHGTIIEMFLIFHGTAVQPPHFARLPRTYSAFRLPNGRTNL